jgi:hypothetical protein
MSEHLAAGVPAVAVLARGKNHQTLNRDIGRRDDGPSGFILEFLQSKAPRLSRCRSELRAVEAATASHAARSFFHGIRHPN